MILNLIKNIQKQIAQQRTKHAQKPKGIAPPYQPPIVYNEIKLEKIELEHFISFEEIERNKIPKHEVIDIAERDLGIRISGFIRENNLGHLMVEQHEWEDAYRFRAKLFIGIDKRLYDKSIKNIEDFKSN